jgi:hypothetical protein
MMINISTFIVYNVLSFSQLYRVIINTLLSNLLFADYLTKNK